VKLVLSEKRMDFGSAEFNFMRTPRNRAASLAALQLQHKD
jgi:hypothetical protein